MHSTCLLGVQVAVEGKGWMVLETAIICSLSTLNNYDYGIF